MRVGNLVVKLVKRYWNEGDMWEVFIKDSKSIGFVIRTITKYYNAWFVLLRYGKDWIKFNTKREAVEYLVGLVNSHTLSIPIPQRFRKPAPRRHSASST